MISSTGYMLFEDSIIFPFIASTAAADCCLGFNVGHKTGAAVNNSGAAVETRG